MHYDTAIIFRKQDCCTLFELFDLESRVVGLYPKLAIEIPNEVFHDGQFQFELANFLHCINSRNSESHTKWYKDNAKRDPCGIPRNCLPASYALLVVLPKLLTFPNVLSLGRPVVRSIHGFGFSSRSRSSHPLIALPLDVLHTKLSCYSS